MEIILIDQCASYLNLPELKEICRQHSWKLKEISMAYNPTKGLPHREKPENWPFKAIFEENGIIYEVRIFSLTVGYRGTGPSDFAEILNFLNVSYNWNDIFTKDKVESDGFIRLKYTL